MARVMNSWLRRLVLSVIESAVIKSVIVICSLFRNRLVQTRPQGAVEAGVKKTPATRLNKTYFHSVCFLLHVLWMSTR
jgi:hypothetical protein